MADYDNRLARGATTATDTIDTGLRAHMLRVYNYMVGALALTGVVAFAVANSPPLLNAFYHQVVTANGVALSPTTISLRRARVSATFIHRVSARKPSSCSRLERTSEMSTASFSRPWQPSTVSISSPESGACSRSQRTCAA